MVQAATAAPVSDLAARPEISCEGAMTRFIFFHELRVPLDRWIKSVTRVTHEPSTHSMAFEWHVFRIFSARERIGLLTVENIMRHFLTVPIEILARGRGKRESAASMDALFSCHRHSVAAEKSADFGEGLIVGRRFDR